MKLLFPPNGGYARVQGQIFRSHLRRIKRFSEDRIWAHVWADHVRQDNRHPYPIIMSTHATLWFDDWK